MKRFITCLMLMSLLLTGCGQYIKEPVTFYYVRSSYEEDMDGLIAAEQREASGHRGDLAYLLALYMMGPAEEELVSPIPRGISIYNLDQADNSITIRLSESGRLLTDSEFALVCACLALTCADITGVEDITISSGERSLSMNTSELVLQDVGSVFYTEETQ